MAVENGKVIVRVGTDEAVKSVKDLRDNVKILKQQLKELEEQEGSNEESWNEYQKTLTELKENQNALKDVMYATTASFDDVTKAAKGQGETYNSLVHQMAKLKEQLRSTDVSTKEGVKTFNDLASQIDGINTKLKNMDKAQGNYQRNVGNYTSALDGLAGSFQTMGANVNGVINPIKGVTAGFQTLSATPVIGILGLLATILTKVIDALDSSAESSDRVSQAFAIFGTAGDAVTKVLQKLGEGVAWVAEKIANLYEKWFGLTEAMELRKEIMEESIALEDKQREAITKNADAQLEIAQLLEKASDKVNYSTKERYEFTKRAGELENEIAQRNYENLQKEYEIIKQKNSLTDSSADDLKKEAEAYAAMVNAQTDYYNKIASNNKKLNALRSESLAALKKDSKETKETFKVTAEDVNKSFEAYWKEQDAIRKEQMEEQRLIDEMTIAMEAETTAEIDALWGDMHLKEFQRMEEERIKAEETAKAKVDTMYGLANATSAIFSSIADIYDSDAKNSEKSAKKAKAIRIASATIDTISGAVGAFTSAAENPGGIPGMIIGAANAAAVTAAGLAQIAKMKSTQISGNGGSSSVGASVSAPSVPTEISQVRNVTSASEEERLNQMASEQRVKLVMSDLEVADNQIRVQTEESSF